MIRNKIKQQGAVSIFIVVFSALLITIITVSFVRIMMQDQQQATIVDLSRSAYDSAQAGVEDAKLALLRYQNACNASSGNVLNTSDECVKYQEWINSTDCNVAITNNKTITSEIPIKTGEDNNLEQAYTCVKVKLLTSDYLGTLNQGDSRVIPLVGTSDFDKVKVEWFSSQNIVTAGGTVSFDTYRSLQPGATNKPPILRAQLIEFGNSFSLSDFDSPIDNTGSSTFFLYPQSTSASLLLADSDLRMNKNNNQPVKATCVSAANSAYSCSSEITIPIVKGGDHSVFMHVSSIYGSATDYRISLVNSTNVAQTVMFNAIQPEIDSTGRANDLFKRVRTRVDLSDINFAYPSSAAEVGGDFCKNFSVTDNAADYSRGGAGIGLAGSCNP